MGENDEKQDFLEVDNPLPGQNYVCLSFVSPESLMESKDAFKVSKFLQSYCKDKELDLDDVMKKYTDEIKKNPSTSVLLRAVVEVAFDTPLIYKVEVLLEST